MKKVTEKDIKEAYRIIQSHRGKASTKVGMSMSERGRLGAKAMIANRKKLTNGK